MTRKRNHVDSSSSRELFYGSRIGRLLGPNIFFLEQDIMHQRKNLRSLGMHWPTEVKISLLDLPDHVQLH